MSVLPSAVLENLPLIWVCFLRKEKNLISISYLKCDFMLAKTLDKLSVNIDHV